MKIWKIQWVERDKGKERNRNRNFSVWNPTQHQQATDTYENEKKQKEKCFFFLRQSQPFINKT